MAKCTADDAVAGRMALHRCFCADHNAFLTLLASGFHAQGG